MQHLAYCKREILGGRTICATQGIASNHPLCQEVMALIRLYMLLYWPKLHRNLAEALKNIHCSTLWYSRASDDGGGMPPHFFVEFCLSETC